MAQRAKTARAARQARHERVRQRVLGTGVRPRLCVFRSLNHIYAQVVDDSQGRTLSAASSLDPEIRGGKTGKAKKDIAQLVGELVAQRAKAAGAKQVVFDRGGFKYHGRVQALADGARKGGLVF